MHYLSGTDLRDLISPTALIAAIEAGLRDFAAGKATVPVRQHVDFGGNTLLTMPAIGDDTFGTKIVSIVPSNATRGIPVVSGLMVLNDGTTGAPLAVMDAAALTAQRTGAVGALGVKYTTPAHADSIGIVGVGVQGTWLAIFACAVRPIRTLYYVARSGPGTRRFVDEVSRRAPNVRLSACNDARELLSKTEIVIAATTSSTPVLPDDRALLQNKHFISAGSFKPSMTELPHLVYELAQQVVVDSDAAKSEVGDLIEPLARGTLREANIVHLAELVTGKRSLDSSSTTVFKSVGMALYDLYAARAFFTEARRLGRGISLA